MAHPGSKGECLQLMNSEQRLILPCLLLFALLLAGILEVGILDVNASSDYWTEKKQPPGPILSAGAVTVNGLVYVVRGECVISPPLCGSLVPSNIAYNPSTDSWTILSPMPTPRELLGVAAVGGKIYAIGGYSNCCNSSSTEVYDPASSSWSEKSPMPIPTADFATAAVDDVIYVMGGQNPQGLTRAVWAYNTTSDRWSPKTSMPLYLPFLGVPSAAALNGSIFVAPNNTRHPDSPAGSLVYNIDGDTWTGSWDGPPFRNSAGKVVSLYSYAMATLSDKIFLIGGIDASNDGNPTTYNLEYDLATGSWTRRQDMPTAREGLLAASANGIIYAIGGCCGSGDRSSVANEAYTLSGTGGTGPSQNNWFNIWIVTGVLVSGSSIGVLVAAFYLKSKRRRIAHNSRESCL